MPPMETSLSLRPTFDLDLEIPADQAAHRLGAIIGAGDGPIVGETVGNHLMLALARRDRHFWSPWLTIEIQPDDQRTRIHARFHPHPNVWTGYMLGYLGVGTATTFAAIFGFVQLTLGHTPWALWIAAIGILAALVMWLAARVGQGLAQEQMEILDTAVRKAVIEDWTPPIHDD